jgi:ABC-type transporter Mla subunit MlaD
MPERANITAVDVLETFRSHLIIYLSKARPTLGEVSSDVLRTKVWLVYWENQVKRCLRRVDDAQQALFGARMSVLSDATSAELMALRKAKQALEEAQGRLARVKQWIKEFDRQLGPMVKQLEKLETVLASDLPGAIAYLAQAIRILDAYTESAPPTLAPAATAAPAAAPAEEPQS